MIEITMTSSDPNLEKLMTVVEESFPNMTIFQRADLLVFAADWVKRTVLDPRLGMRTVSLKTGVVEAKSGD